MRVSVFAVSVPCASPEELVASLKKISGETRITLQAFDSDVILSKRMVEFSFFQAFKAFQEKSGFSESLSVEWLLRCAGTRSIQQAVKATGVKDCSRVVLGIAGEKFDSNSILRLLGAKEKPALLKASAEKQARLAGFFKVPLSSSFPLEDLVLEKIALLNLEK